MTEDEIKKKELLEKATLDWQKADAVWRQALVDRQQAVVDLQQADAGLAMAEDNRRKALADCLKAGANWQKPQESMCQCP